MLLAALVARAQAPGPLPTHVVRSIDPADTDFRDLEFLKAEIGPARVVLLGEPSHGEGNVFAAKIRLVRYLREQLGFTTLAFESGFYDLHKAQQALEAGASAQVALGNSVFPVWTSTREFQAVLPLVGRGGLRVAGFDPQLSGEYSSDMVDDLEQFLAPQKSQAAALNYDYLEETIGYMGEHFAFLPSAKLADFEKELAKAGRAVDKVATGTDAPRRAEAAFWQQNLRSLLAQARDYATHDPGAKTEQEFTAADSNPRDAQMADNLLWYVRQHPQEKVIGWAALPHLANRTDHFDSAELQAYRPMGRAVKDGLGADQVYVLGTLAGGGTHGFSAVGYQPVPVPAANSLEAELLTQPADYAFVSLKHDAPGRRLTTYAFEYKPLAAPWSEAVDGFLFLRSVQPPHGAAAVVAAAPADSAAGRAAPGALNPAAPPRRARTGAAGTAGATTTLLRGVVLDLKTGRSVPYASVSVPGQGVGTVADGAGRFELRAAPGAVRVSSVGYAEATVAAPAAPLTVRLRPSAYELASAEVRGESLDPRKIMRKVLAALPQNYETGNYSADVYTHRQTTNYDTLAFAQESLGQLFVPAGYHHYAGGFLMLGSVPQELTREIHPLKAWAKEQKLFSEQGGPGFNAASADPVRSSPLFQASTLGKFRLHLDSVVERDGQTLYLIAFAAKRASHRSTGTYLTSSYSGRLWVQQRDYAVTRYEALWQADTAYINHATRQWYGKPNIRARLYPNLLATDRTDHAVEYAPGPGGRYRVRRSVGQNQSVGRTMGGPAFYRQSSCALYFTALPPGTPPLLSQAELTLGDVYQEQSKLPKPVYHPEFWDVYQRPSAAR